MTLDRPIFIVGPHRSGTTLLYRLLGRHHDVGYFTPMNKRLPRLPGVAKILTGLLKPDFPVEAQSIWDFFKKGKDDTMGAEDATPETIEWYRHLVERVLHLRKADRFIAKYPRLSLRLPWLNAIFPDALFIHMSRDWRAVVTSTLNRKVKRSGRGGGWFGVYIPGWRDMVDLPHAVAAARQFRVATLAIEKETARFEGRVFKASYEELCSQPRTLLGRLAADCALPFADRFAATIPERFESANFKWRESLDEELLTRIRDEDTAFYARYETAER